MSDRLPPFASLRAFEAAARLQSYSLAARELFVTHGAVSQQIRKLEEVLGQTLFTRVGAKMVPTAEAAALAARVRAAVAEMGAALDAFRVDTGAARLVISCAPFFANHVLTPRLSAFAAQHPGLAIELRREERMVDVSGGEADVGIRHGYGAWPGLEVLRIAGERRAPVCSPAFLERHPIRTASDLAQAPLLMHTDRRWDVWFEALGLAPPRARGVTYDDSELVFTAALLGQGVGLLAEIFARDDLAAGRLVRPVPDMIDTDMGFYMVWRGDSLRVAAITAFRDWLVAETAIAAAAASG